MRVVSTSPSGTEICYALGVEPVAVSGRCSHPPEAVDKPRIDASAIDARTSADRHEQVRDAAASDGVHEVHAERLRAAEPDLIVTQRVCGECAVDESRVETVLGDLDVDPDVLGLQANTLNDCFECIRRVGMATGTEERADELVADLRARLEAIRERVDDRPRPRVAVVEWMDPIHVAGNWVPELVDVAGGDYGLVEAGGGSRTIDWRTLVEYDAEVLVVAPCGTSVGATVERIGELTGRDGWADLAAVRTDRVFAMDGQRYLNRWTPGLVDAAERLASAFHPEAVGAPPVDVRRLPPRSEAEGRDGPQLG